MLILLQLFLSLLKEAESQERSEFPFKAARIRTDPRVCVFKC